MAWSSHRSSVSRSSHDSILPWLCHTPLALLPRSTMSQPARPLPPDAPPSERRAQLERSPSAQGQPTTLAGWRDLLGPLPAHEEGEESLEAFEEALRDVRKRPGKAPLR